MKPYSPPVLTTLGKVRLCAGCGKPFNPAELPKGWRGSKRRHMACSLAIRVKGVSGVGGRAQVRSYSIPGRGFGRSRRRRGARRKYPVGFLSPEKTNNRRRIDRRRRLGRRGEPSAAWLKIPMKKNCECCGKKLGKGEGVRDHVVPRRLSMNAAFLTFLFGESKNLPSPDSPKNCAILCRECHGRKGAAETALCAGDMLTGWRILTEMRYPLDKAKRALAMYGFKTEALRIAA